MKKGLNLLPWVLVALFAAWIGKACFPKPERGMKIQEFGRLPVLLEGRIQPLDSVGRNSLLQIRAKQYVLVEQPGLKPWQHPPELSASEWLAEVLMKPEAANARKIFRIDHPELLGMLKLPPDEKHFSYDQIKGLLDQIDKETQRLRQKDDKLWTHFEKQVMRLANALAIFNRLKSSLKPESTEDFAAELAVYEQRIGPGVAAIRAEHAGQTFDKKAYDALLESLTHYQALSRIALPILIPPLNPGHSREAWQNVGASLMESARIESIHPAVKLYAALSRAYGQGQVEEFNHSLAAYQQWLAQQKFDAEIRKGREEHFFNALQPFYKATVIYVLAFVLACCCWFSLNEPLRRSALYLTVLGLVVHTVGLAFRMYLEGRPPVTNLYSSAVFIGWGAVLLGLVLERFFPAGIGTVTGAGIGFNTLIIAHNLALGGDTMPMLRAVLDTNFWLATHVITITIGYSATFVAGFLAILYILRGVCTRSLTAEMGRALARMTYGIVCFGTLFSFIGTVLGGIWADQSWGRFWGWDPKENGALIIVLWNALILHARWGNMIDERGLMNLAIFGNVVTSFSWFGVNMLGIGLHSYGFMDAAFKWLMGFIVSQLALIALGCLPLRFWRSFAPGQGPPTGLTSAPDAAQPAAS
jgi:ABC-type transport system involved in cytochrome c biogenesis permease subunit